MSKKNANIKKRNWTMLVYPESAPKNWREFLTETCLPIAISPLHDKDVDPTGELKKEHYHVILCFPGPTTFNVVQQICDELNAPIPKPLEAVRGMYRYFTHKDNPDKYQYDEHDISVINGFSISDYNELTRSEVNEIKMNILELICQRSIIEYSQLLDILRNEGLPEEFDIAVNNTLMLNTYITSRRHQFENMTVRREQDNPNNPNN